MLYIALLLFGMYIYNSLVFWIILIVYYLWFILSDFILFYQRVTQYYIMLSDTMFFFVLQYISLLHYIYILNMILHSIML